MPTPEVLEARKGKALLVMVRDVAEVVSHALASIRGPDVELPGYMPLQVRFPEKAEVAVPLLS